MDIETLTSFFMWCTIFNMGLLVFWTVICILAPDMVYKLHHRWFPLSRESFNVVIYSFLGLFKILVLFFNVIPYIVLLIVGSA